MPHSVLYSWQIVPLSVIWILGFGYRRYNGDRDAITDGLMLGLLSLWQERDYLKLLIPQRRLPDHINIFIPGIAESKQLLYLCELTAAWVLISLWLWRKKELHSPSTSLDPSLRQWSLPHPEAKIFPCQTIHSRIFPKKHSFGYSYLQCGYPIIPDAVTSTGLNISYGNDRVMGSWWMKVKADDYLERGHDGLGFYGKLQQYLRNHHVKDSDWAYAYLVTAPRFFTYAFNPVSFWYVYDDCNQLTRMILEVNNTFGERRVYLLHGSKQFGTAQPSKSVQKDNEAPFTDLWSKDFHVSPFNSRKGSYALKATNPFPITTFDQPVIDNTITLKSSKEHGKLVARLVSTRAAMNPGMLDFTEQVHFVLSWWWIGFLTFPRILLEAFKLFFRRKLHVWFRPEVSLSSIGRLPTQAEITLHGIFSDYLSHLVESAKDAFEITLITAIPPIPSQIITPITQYGNDKAVLRFEIRVLSPGFYSRLVHYTSVSEAFDRECILTEEQNRTVWLSHPQLLSRLLPRRSSSFDEDRNYLSSLRHILGKLRWRLLENLRCLPAAPAYSDAQAGTSHDLQDIRALPYSELDQYVWSHQTCARKGEYRKIVTKLFLAERFCFGFTGLIGAVDFSVRVLVCYLGSKAISEYVRDYSEQSLVWQWEWGPLSGRACLVFGAHAYSLVKGYR